jgi:hypothetical protein
MPGGEGGCIDILYSMPNPLLWYASIAATVFLVYRFVLDRDWRQALVLVGIAATWLPWIAYPERTIFQFYTIAIWPFLLALTFALQRVAGAASADRDRRTAGQRRARLLLGVAVALSIFWYPWSGMQVPYEFYRLHNWMQGWPDACPRLRWRAMPSRTRDLLPAGAARQRRAGRDRARDRGHQVVIVAGATGSGKTTQLPKICLELGRTAIAHTQPRASPRGRSPSASRRSSRCPRRRRRLQGALHRPGLRGHQDRARHRRHPAQRDPPRPAAAPLRHDHRRRGARAIAEHRLPAGYLARSSPSGPT